MNLNHLRFVSAVASTRSFTAASLQCNVTQPTLSNGIAQLEEELGERLFIRTTRTVTLTGLGEHLLPYINEVLAAQKALLKQSQTFQKPAKRLIRIGTSPLVNAKLLGAAIEPYSAANPGVEIIFREMNMADLDRMLHGGLLDFIFGVASVHKGNVETAFLYDELLLFLPRKGEWSGSPQSSSVRLQDIANETYVMVPDACGLARATRALFRTNRRKLSQYSGEAMSYQVLEEWADLGIGAAILPVSKIHPRRQKSLSITDKEERKVKISFEAVWNRDAAKVDHLQTFAKHLKLIVPNLVEGVSIK